MPEPTVALQALRSSTADLLQGLESEGWGDADAHGPSRCHGWTRGHVLTHLARNADGISATVSGALRGEVVPRYPGGPASRDAEIEAGAGRPFAELLADVRASAERLDRVLGALTDEGWDLPTEDQHPASHWVGRRLVEVEVHRVDLAGAYTADRWPPVLITDELPTAIGTLEQRSSSAVEVTVTEAGTVVPELAGRTWSVGTGPVTAVSGPDWALLAWLIGRPDAAGDALDAPPELGPWR